MSGVLDVLARSSMSLTFAGFFALLLLLALRQLVGSLEWFSEKPRVRTVFKLVNRVCLILSTIVVTVGFAGYIIGQINPPLSLEEQVITLNVKEKPLQDVIKEVARQIGAVSVVDPSITGTLSVSMTAEVNDFMNEICYEAENCSWKIQPGDPPALVVLPPGAVPPPEGR